MDDFFAPTPPAAPPPSPEVAAARLEAQRVEARLREREDQCVAGATGATALVAAWLTWIALGTPPSHDLSDISTGIAQMVAAIFALLFGGVVAWLIAHSTVQSRRKDRGISRPGPFANR